MEEDMNLLELSELLLNEKKAEEYLLKVGILKTFTECSKCGSSRITKISRGRHRCNSCLSEWSNKKGSVLYNNNLSYSKFIGIVKLFHLGVPAGVTSVQLSITPKTVEVLYSLLRQVIVSPYEIITDTVIKDRTQNFAISIINGVVNISPNKNNVKTNLFNMKRTRVPNKETVYYFDYTNLKPSKIEKCINQMPIEQSYFWRYAREQLQSYRGTKSKYLYMYLKEIEFRYNNRYDNLFDKIIAKIARF